MDSSVDANDVNKSKSWSTSTCLDTIPEINLFAWLFHKFERASESPQSIYRVQRVLQRRSERGLPLLSQMPCQNSFGKARSSEEVNFQPSKEDRLSKLASKLGDDDLDYIQSKIGFYENIVSQIQEALVVNDKQGDKESAFYSIDSQNIVNLKLIIGTLEEKAIELQSVSEMGDASFLDAQCVNDSELMSLLERTPLTVDDLTNTLKAPKDTVRATARKLLDKGYIDEMGGGVIHKIFPGIAEKERREVKFSDVDTSFILTLKGYLKLHSPGLFHSKYLLESVEAEAR